ncbi:hypothetical protein B566_EDAN001979 [Ephemera danica]|nr:hypothetical protein B566_EDAN001979 [Ephemera danica]
MIPLLILQFSNELTVMSSVVSLLVVVLLQVLLTVSGTSTECMLSGFECVGASRVRQCVDGVSQGAEILCSDGLVCDVTAQFGPCVQPDPEPCCYEGAFPIPGNCRAYMMCINNGLRLFQHHGACAPGFEFSAAQSTCLPTALANCSIPLPPVTTTSTTTTTTAATSASTTTPVLPSTTVIIPSTTTTVVVPRTTLLTSTTRVESLLDLKSMCKSPGIIPDPTSCRHYIVCSWASQNTVRGTRDACTSGLFFDVALNQCVFTTNCGSRPM